MANPQAENGHVDIAHEIIEALAKYRIPGESMQCLWVVFRKTYGWKKIEDEISLSQFVQFTGLKRPNVVRAIKWLVSKKILYSINNDTTYANKYKFNKDFETWAISIKKDTSKKVVSEMIPQVVSKKIMRPVSKKIHTKETYTKETSKESISVRKNREADPRVKQVIDYFHTQFKIAFGSSPAINGPVDGNRVKAALRVMELEDVFKCIDFFIPSTKAREMGCTLSIALSSHTLNQYKQGGQNAGRARFERIFGVSFGSNKPPGDVHREETTGSRGEIVDGEIVEVSEMEVN